MPYARQPPAVIPAMRQTNSCALTAACNPPVRVCRQDPSVQLPFECSMLQDGSYNSCHLHECCIHLGQLHSGSGISHLRFFPLWTHKILQSPRLLRCHSRKEKSNRPFADSNYKMRRQYPRKYGSGGLRSAPNQAASHLRLLLCLSTDISHPKSPFRRQVFWPHPVGGTDTAAGSLQPLHPLQDKRAA